LDTPIPNFRNREKDFTVVVSPTETCVLSIFSTRRYFLNTLCSIFEIKKIYNCPGVVSTTGKFVLSFPFFDAVSRTAQFYKCLFLCFGVCLYCVVLLVRVVCSIRNVREI
jgi:hypothetical protein